MQKWCNKTWLSKGCCNMHTMSSHFRNNLQRTSFDLDSQPLMFNDGASTSITNDLQDFVTQQNVKGIAGSAKAHIVGLSNGKLRTTIISFTLCYTKYLLHRCCPNKNPITTTFRSTDARSQATCWRNGVYDYKYDNSVILGPEKFTKTV